MPEKLRLPSPQRHLLSTLGFKKAEQSCREVRYERPTGESVSVAREGTTGYVVSACNGRELREEAVETDKPLPFLVGQAVTFVTAGDVFDLHARA